MDGRQSVSELAERMKMTEDEVREIMKVTMDALSIETRSTRAYRVKISR